MSNHSRLAQHKRNKHLRSVKQSGLDPLDYKNFDLYRDAQEWAKYNNKLISLDEYGNAFDYDPLAEEAVPEDANVFEPKLNRKDPPTLPQYESNIKPSVFFSNPNINDKRRTDNSNPFIALSSMPRLVSSGKTTRRMVKKYPSRRRTTKRTYRRRSNKYGKRRTHKRRSASGFPKPRYSRVRGRGAYSISQTGGRLMQSVPLSTHPIGEGAIKFSRREPLCKVYGHEGFANALAPTGQTTDIYYKGIVLNPALDSAAPWGSALSRHFEMYKYTKCLITFESTVNTQLAQGEVIMANTETMKQYVDLPDSAEDMKSSALSQSARIDRTFSMGIECNRNISMNNGWKFTRSVDVDGDLNDFDWARCFVYTQGCGTAYEGKVIGNLWITYDVELSRPRRARAVDPHAPISYNDKKNSNANPNDAPGTKDGVVTDNKNHNALVYSQSLTKPLMDKNYVEFNGLNQFSFTGIGKTPVFPEFVYSADAVSPYSEFRFGDVTKNTTDATYCYEGGSLVPTNFTYMQKYAKSVRNPLQLRIMAMRQANSDLAYGDIISSAGDTRIFFPFTPAARTMVRLEIFWNGFKSDEQVDNICPYATINVTGNGFVACPGYAGTGLSSTQLEQQYYSATTWDQKSNGTSMCTTNQGIPGEDVPGMTDTVFSLAGWATQTSDVQPTGASSTIRTTPVSCKYYQSSWFKYSGSGATNVAGDEAGAPGRKTYDPYLQIGPFLAAYEQRLCLTAVSSGNTDNWRTPAQHVTFGSDAAYASGEGVRHGERIIRITLLDQWAPHEVPKISNKEFNATFSVQNGGA